MSQETKIIDIRRSYIPKDPNAFEATYHDTQAEDSPEPRIPVVPYDGYNFMPTPQGYASFFGINSALEIDTLVASGGTGNVDDLFMIQTNTFQNILVAFCDDGIWTKSAAATGVWAHTIELDPPDDPETTHLLWSKCVIENTVYAYRQGEANVYQAGPANNFLFEGFVPSFLNMAGQLGIFKAGGRLGFWDSENSTAWAALGDPTDVVPDLETLAGNTIFQDIVGRIVNVLQHGTGFIIYCTKSIVLVRRNLNSPMIWAGTAIFNSNGISYREEVCFAEPDTRHFAFTTQGLIEINEGKPEFVIPEVSTYLKEKRQPVYVKVLNGRYLFFPILDPEYFTGIIHITSEEFPAISQTWPGASYSKDNVGESVCKAYQAIDGQSREIAIYEANPTITRCGQATANGVVRKYQDNLSTTVPLATLVDYKNNGIDPAFDTNGLVTGIDGNDLYLLPNVLLQLSAGYAEEIHEEDNTNDFYKKQEAIWVYEDRFAKDWINAIRSKLPRTVVTTTEGVPNGAPSEPMHLEQFHSFGPYALPTFESESNRVYGKADKSQWLQRSLTQLLTVRIPEFRSSEAIPGQTDAGWANDGVWGGNATTFGGNVPASYASYAALPPTAAHIAALIPDNLDPPRVTTYSGVSQNIDLVTGVAQYVISWVQDVGGGIGPGSATCTFTSNEAGGALTATLLKRIQQFGKPQLVYTPINPCTIKEIGFTEIIGHGHFDANCNYIADDTTPEAPDHVDACIAEPNPPKRKNPIFLDLITDWQDLVCGQTEVEIDSEIFQYPDITVTIPGGTILLQEGSIEPIYPTYLGAFVYDLHYKKWGKMKQEYKQLLDYFPVNNIAGDSPIPYDTFLPKCAALLQSGAIALFDVNPSDSRIVFGKIGMFRKGFTDIQEVRIQNRTPLTGTITVEGSLDGKTVESFITQTREYTDAVQVTTGFGLSARWFNVIVEGNYDLVAAETRITRKGKR